MYNNERKGFVELPVPASLAVVGYDDIPAAALVSPALTTCRVPRHELGAQATRLLLERVGGKLDDSKVVLLPELVVRASAQGATYNNERKGFAELEGEKCKTRTFIRAQS